MSVGWPARIWRPSRALYVAGVLALTWGGCISTLMEAVREPEPTTATWPDPDPSRPVVDLTFTVSDDLASVVGTERVRFTPDLEVCELVFRLWPNKPATSREGNALVVDQVIVGGVAAEVEVIAAGAPDDAPGTLAEVDLPACAAAGTAMDAELGFTLTLGPGTDERVGVTTEGNVAWFGTAFPLLAWENGRGWAREPAVRVAGEMATSETFHLRSLEVVAPSRFEVLGTGTREESLQLEGADTTTHRFSAPAVRDVTVTVGELEVITHEVDGVRLHVGGSVHGTRAPLTAWAEQLERSIRDIAAWLGPLPYEDLWVSVLPDQTQGIEFPGALQFGDVRPDEQAWLVTHEVAHQWFYGLVGNNQARDPWLDEAFATFVQLVVEDEPASLRGMGGPGGRADAVGQPMTYWETMDHPTRAYVRGVYREGGAALVEARERAGADAFDAALVDYLFDNAHRIAVPADVEAAFAAQPDVLVVLRDVGALPDEPDGGL